MIRASTDTVRSSIVGGVRRNEGKASEDWILSPSICLIPIIYNGMSANLLICFLDFPAAFHTHTLRVLFTPSVVTWARFHRCFVLLDRYDQPTLPPSPHPTR
jgi:hypothetical protein